MTSARDGSVTCFEHVHPDLFSVYDFSYWTLKHPGNYDARDNYDRNPISAFAERDRSAYMVFPSWHAMSRWDQYKDDFTLVGRLGDVVDFAELDVQVRTEEMAARVGARRRSLRRAARRARRRSSRRSATGTRCTRRTRTR